MASLLGLGEGEEAIFSGGNSRTDFDRSLARPDPLTSVDWDVIVQWKGLSIDISDYIEEVTLPSIKLDTKQVFRQGMYRNVPKTESAGSVMLKLYETSDLIALRFFRYWKNRVRDPQGNYGSKSDYSGKLLLYPKAPDKSSTAVLECIGCYPISLPPYNFSSGTAERIVGEIEMACDDVRPKAAG